MSPVFILSRLCLKRRFQFFGISVDPPVSAFSTTATSFSPMTRRRPTASAFSHGTCTVMSLCRILIVRYSRFVPSTSRDSFLTIVPAPWCGYTTLSPTLYNADLPFQHAFRQKSRHARAPAQYGYLIRKSPGKAPVLAFLSIRRLQFAPFRG